MDSHESCTANLELYLSSLSFVMSIWLATLRTILSNRPRNKATYSRDFSANKRLSKFSGQTCREAEVRVQPETVEDHFTIQFSSNTGHCAPLNHYLFSDHINRLVHLCKLPFIDFVNLAAQIQLSLQSLQKIPAFSLTPHPVVCVNRGDVPHPSYLFLVPRLARSAS